MDFGGRGNGNGKLIGERDLSDCAAPAVVVQDGTVVSSIGYILCYVLFCTVKVL